MVHETAANESRLLTSACKGAREMYLNEVSEVLKNVAGKTSWLFWLKSSQLSLVAVTSKTVGKVVNAHLASDKVVSAVKALKLSGNAAVNSRFPLMSRLVSLGAEGQ